LSTAPQRSIALGLTTLVCLASLVTGPPRAAAAVPRHAECDPARHPVATVVVLSSPRDCTWFAAHGLRAAYPTGPIGERPFAKVYRTIRALVTNYVHRDPDSPVFVFGWSRGGTVGEWLAEHGAVTAAVVYSAPSDLVDWWQNQTSYWESIHMTEEDRRAASPLFHVGRRPAPLLLLHSPGDNVVPVWHSREMHRRVPSSTLLLTSAPHGPPDYAVRRAAYDFFHPFWAHRSR
jgi:alpha-beta hydrolase superfamily lysophospholipase